MNLKRFCSVLLCSALLLCSVPCSARADTRSRATPAEWATPSEILISDSLDASELYAGIQLPTIANTVDYDDIYISLNYYNLTGQSVWKSYEIGSDGYFRLTVPDNYSQFRSVFFNLESGSLPPSGKYQFQAYVTPEAGGVFRWYGGYVQASNKPNNASTSFTSQIAMDTQQDNYGGIYATINLDTQNYSALQFILIQQSGETFTFPFSGYAKFAFARTGDATTGPDLSGINSSEDIQSDINNTVGNISSGVSEVSDQISELIQTIINQLDALWNQFSGEFTNMFTAWNTHVQTITNAIQNQGTTVSDGLENVVSEVDSSSDQIVDNADENTDKITQNQDKNTNIITEALSALGNFIIEGLKSLFIPSDDFFQNWYTDLYDFFNDRLGLFMLPIDIVIQLINVYINTDSSFAGIPFPEFKWIDGTVIIPAQTVNFTFLETDWGQDIQQKIYFVTDIFMIFSLLVLLKKKLDEVFVQ